MKNVLFAALFGIVTATTTWAQAQPAPARPAAPAAPAVPPAPATAPVPAPQPLLATAAQPGGSRTPRNVRFDIFITETGSPRPGTKTISITVNDSNGNGSVRNIVKAPGDSSVSLNVDVRNVQGFDTGTVRANINVEYQPYTPDLAAPTSGVVASATSMFQDGRRTQILQTSDPLSDRRTTIEVLATFLK